MRWVVTSFTVCLAYKPEDESVKRVCWTDTEKIKKCSIYHELSFSLLFWPPCSRYTVSVQRSLVAGFFRPASKLFSEYISKENLLAKVF